MEEILLIATTAQKISTTSILANNVLSSQRLPPLSTKTQHVPLKPQKQHITACHCNYALSNNKI